VFPLYLVQGDRRVANFHLAFVKAFQQKLGLEYRPTGRGDLVASFGSEDLLHYIYGCFFSRWYRERYAVFLREDFPRIPFAERLDEFRARCRIGSELMALHTLSHPLEVREHFTMDVRVQTVEYEEGSNGMGRIRVAPDRWIDRVDKRVWEFAYGGYRPARKWLSDRKGAMVSAGQWNNYGSMLMALEKTVERMLETDL
jgi:predicted helicase